MLPSAPSSVVWSRVMVVGVLVVLGLAGIEAEAGWHHHARQCCPSCGDSCGSSGGSIGHHHRCRRCRHASHGGSSGGSHGSSGGSAGGGSSGGSPKAADGKASDAKKTAAVGVPADGVMLVVEVPEDATLLVNGRETALAGAVRNFVSAGLADDQQYDYTISMRVTRNGQVEEQTKTVSVSAGQRHVVAFDASAVPGAALPEGLVSTALTLRVPESARVWIEGQSTSKAGAIRQFSTSALRAGESWEGYEVKVAMVVEGREIVQTKRITLVGGKDIELAIDPAAVVAGAPEAVAPAAREGLEEMESIEDMESVALSTTVAVR